VLVLVSPGDVVEQYAVERRAISGVPVMSERLVSVRAGKAGAETRAVGDTGPVGAVDDEQATNSEPTAARRSGTKRRTAADRRPTTRLWLRL